MIIPVRESCHLERSEGPMHFVCRAIGAFTAAPLSNAFRIFVMKKKHRVLRRIYENKGFAGKLTLDLTKHENLN